MVTKDVVLQEANVRAVKDHKGYNYFERDGVRLVAVQQIGQAHHFIIAEQPARTVEDLGDVVPTLLEVLGLDKKDGGARHELSSFLWKDWD